MKFENIMTLMMASILLAPSASALSCAPPNIISDLNRAKDSESIYYIFVGKFSVNSPEDQASGPLYKTYKSPDGNVLQLKPLNIEGQNLEASFTGYSLAGNRHQDVELNEFPVTIKTNCAASWCGQPPKEEQELIAFVEVPNDGAPILTMGPCGGWAHDYTPARLETVRRCIGQDCAASYFGQLDEMLHE